MSYTIKIPDRNWGFVPLSLEELEYAANDLKAIVDPSLVMIAEKAGVPVGFSMVVPNINEFLSATCRSNRLMRILKFADGEDQTSQSGAACYSRSV